MDRLEKALEKARQYGVSMPRSDAPPPPLETSRAPFQTPPVDVSPATLEQGRIVAHGIRSPQADVFRLLRTQVLQKMNKEGWRSLAITSPNYGDGKSTVSANLALSIALDLKQTVLLADLDLRKPSTHKLFGLQSSTGLIDYLIRSAPLSDLLIRLNFDRLSILPAGPSLDASSEILGSPRMAALAHELKTRYQDRIIIYDMPPALAQDDPIAFLPHVDAVLVVVRDGVTPEQEVTQTLHSLANAGANVIGTVLNNAPV